MIELNNKQITEVYLGNSSITEVYIGDELVFGYEIPSGGTKYVWNYDSKPTVSAECDSSSTVYSGDLRYNYSLISAEIGSCVKHLGGNLFNSCSKLSAITIPDTIQTIGVGTFQSCPKMTSYEFSSRLSEIGDSAFRSNTYLTSITFHSTTPPTIGSYVFMGCDNLTIYVPSESLNAYKTAWSEWASIIQAIPTPQHDLS